MCSGGAERGGDAHTCSGAGCDPVFRSSIQSLLPPSPSGSTPSFTAKISLMTSSLPPAVAEP